MNRSAAGLPSTSAPSSSSSRNFAIASCEAGLHTASVAVMARCCLHGAGALYDAHTQPASDAKAGNCTMYVGLIMSKRACVRLNTCASIQLQHCDMPRVHLTGSKSGCLVVCTSSILRMTDGARRRHSSTVVPASPGPRMDSTKCAIAVAESSSSSMRFCTRSGDLKTGLKHPAVDPGMMLAG